VTDDEVAIARRVRDDYRARCEDAMDELDLLVTPTIGFAAPPDDVDEPAIRERGIAFTFPFDSLGWPAIALPCGEASVQLVGRRGDDALVLAAGARLESEQRR
jgi:Asp-tRNA(Asn)/Glu-tRNA(Gln) amidotransferase A subunit family amidase